MSRYAEGTNVSVEKSLAEIQSTLRRYGAVGFGYAECEGAARVEFKAHDRYVRFVLTLPERSDPEFARTPGRQLRRSSDATTAAWEAACRQRWRALALCIKAKLEAVQSEISTFEDEFLANTVMPGDKTVAEMARSAVAEAYASGKVTSMIAIGFNG